MGIAPPKPYEDLCIQLLPLFTESHSDDREVPVLCRLLHCDWLSNTVAEVVETVVVAAAEEFPPVVDLPGDICSGLMTIGGKFEAGVVEVLSFPSGVRGGGGDLFFLGDIEDLLLLFVATSGVLC